MKQNTKITRGIRNNNPLNIRRSRSQWLGACPDGCTPTGEPYDRSFEQFTDMAYGFRAALVLLNNYVRLQHRNTIEKIIARWAPPRSVQEPHGLSTESTLKRPCPPLSPHEQSSMGTPGKDYNDTEAYVLTVCRLTGIGGKEGLTADDPRLRDIAWAMAQVECGPHILAYADCLDRAWDMLYAPDFSHQGQSLL